jgi:hypothetical protein
MKSLKFDFLKKRKLSLSDLHKDGPNPNSLWGISLIVVVVLVLLGALVGLILFRSVYFENYKNEEGFKEGIMATININGLKSAVEKRSGFQNGTISIPPDPSI